MGVAGHLAPGRAVAAAANHSSLVRSPDSKPASKPFISSRCFRAKRAHVAGQRPVGSSVPSQQSHTPSPTRLGYSSSGSCPRFWQVNVRLASMPARPEQADVCSSSEPSSQSQYLTRPEDERHHELSGECRVAAVETKGCEQGGYPSFTCSAEICSPPPQECVDAETLSARRKMPTATRIRRSGRSLRRCSGRSISQREIKIQGCSDSFFVNRQYLDWSES